MLHKYRPPLGRRLERQCHCARKDMNQFYPHHLSSLHPMYIGQLCTMSVQLLYQINTCTMEVATTSVTQDEECHHGRMGSGIPLSLPRRGLRLPHLTQTGSISTSTPQSPTSSLLQRSRPMDSSLSQTYYSDVMKTDPSLPQSTGRCWLPKGVQCHKVVLGHLLYCMYMQIGTLLLNAFSKYVWHCRQNA